jgi:LacI family transcriptional regulator
LKADGIIMRDVGELQPILRRGIPMVVFGHGRPEIPGLANVITEDAAVGIKAAEHLWECGFRHFAYCGLAWSDIEATPWSHKRAQAFQQRLEKAGHTAKFFTPPAGVRARADELPGLMRWLASLPKPVGIMACNDDRAQVVVEACKQGSLRVPDEVGIIGADNDELVTNLTDPPLSSVAINFEKAGYEGARVLDRLMQGEAPASVIITARATHVVARKSTDVIFLEDAQVVRALRYIRNHARHAIRVTEVATAAGLSRRVLEKRFRNLVGRSVLGEIRRVRVEQISRLLAETTMPVAAIAETLNFDDAQHIARYFFREKQLQPLQYRKQFGR